MTPPDSYGLALALAGFGLLGALAMLGILVRFAGVLTGALAYCGFLGFAGCIAGTLGAEAAAFGLVMVGLTGSAAPLALCAADFGVSGRAQNAVLAAGVAGAVFVLGVVAWGHGGSISGPLAAVEAPSPLTPSAFAVLGLLAVLAIAADARFAPAPPVEPPITQAIAPSVAAARTAPGVLVIVAAALLWSPGSNGLAAGAAIALALVLHAVLAGEAAARRTAPAWLLRFLLLGGVFAMAAATAAAALRTADPFSADSFLTVEGGVNVGVLIHQTGLALAAAGALPLAHRGLSALLSAARMQP